jgi:hypothetical protein
MISLLKRLPLLPNLVKITLDSVRLDQKFPGINRLSTGLDDTWYDTDLVPTMNNTDFCVQNVACLHVNI